MKITCNKVTVSMRDHGLYDRGFNQSSMNQEKKQYCQAGVFRLTDLGSPTPRKYKLPMEPTF